MRALKEIDIAFVPMNLPFTMDIDQASSAVAEFKPGGRLSLSLQGQRPQGFRRQGEGGRGGGRGGAGKLVRVSRVARAGMRSLPAALP